MPRMAAWEILRSDEGRTTPLRAVARVAAEHGFDARDRGLLRRLVGTEVRRRGTLRAVVRHYARGKPTPEMTTHLHIGCAQALFFDRIPPHAIVSETVANVHATLGPSKARYANAVLRAVLRDLEPGHVGDPRRDVPGRDLHFREPVFRDPDEHPLLWAEDALSMPSALMKAWRKRHGPERAEALARACLAEPPLSVRAVGETPRDALLAELEGARASGHPRLVLLDPDRTEAVIASPAFREGRATVQGEAALRAAELLEARSGERVLDLCASPGGKTAVLAEAGATVTACAIGPREAERLEETAARLHLGERVCIVPIDAETARPLPAFPAPDAPGEDPTASATEPADLGLFDGVLVDAPCSNTGVLAQRPEARWRHGPATRASLRELQVRLLDQAAEHVRPGGRLVWSTCSLEPAENGQLVRRFLDSHPGWGMEVEREVLPEVEGGAGPVDGGYAARLRRPSG